MNYRNLLAAFVAVGIACSSSAQRVRESDMSPPRLGSAHVARAPILDGVGDDAAWKATVPLQVIARRPLPPNEGDTVPVMIRSVHTDTRIFFLVSWEDSTESVSHKTWVWNANSQSYDQGDDREDMFALAFEHTGPFDADMLAGIEAVWDVWHWKAFRTNPQGYATDKTHHYTLTRPQRKAKSHTARNEKEIWVARPEDSGDSVERKRPAPTIFDGERVAQYVPTTPSGSAADVRARGVWFSGAWTLELSRRLDTGHPDDTALDLDRSYRIAVAPFDHTGAMDKASGVIRLTFVQPAASNDFESDEPGAVPSGFAAARTGRGDPGEWVVREETNAPSGRRVVAQISNDSTNYRLPVLVYEELTATDVDVSVRFKPVSGKIDQGAGIVWRYQDVDNYYVVRANALENNVVAYKVEKGTRSNIGVKRAGSAYGVNTEIPSGQWSSLRVVADGSLFEIYSNDRKLFEVEDATFAKAGWIGLWTKADSVTYFDDLTIFSLDHFQTSSERR